MQGTGQGATNHAATPQKALNSHSDSENKGNSVTNTVKLTPKMKGIISQVRQSSYNRMRRRRQEEISRADYYYQVQEMLKTIKINGKCNITDVLTNPDLITRISAKELHVQAVVSHNQQKRQKIVRLLGSLEKQAGQGKTLQESLKNTKKDNKHIIAQLKFAHALKQNLKQSEQEKDSLGKATLERYQQILKLLEDVEEMIRRTSQTIEKINQTNIDIQKAQQYQLKLSQTLVQLPKRKIPNQQQMIKCIFLVGILSQQNFVLFLDKKLRTNQKNIIQQKTNRFQKIYQSLCKRTIQINCKNSQIAHLRIATSIYMHCKSLVLANLVTTMSTLSFFSQEFKTIYHYKQFAKYIKVLMEKTRFNPEWVRMKPAVQLGVKELPMCKKQLVISVKEENIIFLQGILDIFVAGDEYIVNLGSIKMKLQLEAIHEPKTQCQKPSQASISEYPPCAAQENRLHFEFQGL